MADTTPEQSDPRRAASGARCPVIIGNASGYWGDDPYALRRQLAGPIKLDYITMDLLAELSMSILQKQRAGDPTAGWARDFVTQVRPLLPELLRKGTRVVTNAGGVNPQGCAEALLAAARELSLPLRVAVVFGDDVLDRVGELRAAGIDMRHMDTGEGIDTVAARLVSANAYFGALPVCEALRFSPDIVVCGRVTDTGITMGPMMFELGWKEDDYDKLASGIAAGHIIECGAQSTGGNFTDWCKVTSFEEVGYPILECHADGSFVVTKQPGSGGLVSLATVKEQLVYEMGDPTEYLAPDCVADFTSLRLAADGPDRVRVSGARGRPPTPFLKVSAAFDDGFKASGSLIVSGPDAREKARRFLTICWDKLDAELRDVGVEQPEERLAELVGDDACHGGLTPRHRPTEVLLRLSLRDHDRRSLDIFRKLLPSLILSGPPGVAVTGGTPRVREVVSFWPCLIPREAALPSIQVWEQREGEGTPRLVGGVGPLPWPSTSQAKPARRVPEPGHRTPTQPLSGPFVRIPLAAIAHARSGDKGDTANVGLIARSEACFDWLAEHLTAARVKRWFGGIALGPVRRHVVPNLLAFNFLLENALGGGGTRSLKLDAQGKTLAQALLRCRVTVPACLLDTIAAEDAPCGGELLGGRARQ